MENPSQPKSATEKTEKEQIAIGRLADFDPDYFRQLAGEKGWSALGQESCRNQKYFTVLGDTGEKLGIVGVYDTADERNITHTVVEPKLRGQGLAWKFKQKLMDQLGLDSLTLTIDLDNEASLKAARKIPGIEKASDEAYEREFHKAKYVYRRPAEAPIDPEAIHEKLASLLLAKGVVAPEEAALLDAARLDEMIVRSGHELADLPEVLPPGKTAKLRRMLGLEPEVGRGRVDPAMREREIDALAGEMRGYLERFRTACPEVIGFILCGSRFDAGKRPAESSDVDMVPIVKPGASARSHDAAGQALVWRLRAFSDANPSAAGLPVELDEVYTSEELLSVLGSVDDTNRLVWGWNPGAVRYVGDGLAGLDEAGFQDLIRQDLVSPAMRRLRQRRVAEAQRAAAPKLGLTQS